MNTTVRSLMRLQSIEAWGTSQGVKREWETRHGGQGGGRKGYQHYQISEYEHHEAPNCPSCGGEGFHLGTLGSREHFRCRNCGTDFSHKGEK